MSDIRREQTVSDDARNYYVKVDDKLVVDVYQSKTGKVKWGKPVINILSHTTSDVALAAIIASMVREAAHVANAWSLIGKRFRRTQGSRLGTVLRPAGEPGQLIVQWDELDHECRIEAYLPDSGALVAVS